jgi:hypothetical protein
VRNIEDGERCANNWTGGVRFKRACDIGCQRRGRNADIDVAAAGGAAGIQCRNMERSVEDAAEGQVAPPAFDH